MEVLKLWCIEIIYRLMVFSKVAILEEKGLKLPVASNLTSSALMKILVKATEGYIGRLDEILREAA